MWLYPCGKFLSYDFVYLLHRLVLKKDDLDDAFKDKKFPESAKVEFLFGVNCDSSSQGEGVFMLRLLTCTVEHVL